MVIKKIVSPLSESTISSLKAGDSISLSGKLITARDGSHERIVTALKAGRELPFQLKGQTVYYMGPSPARPGQVIGSAGPTTSSRMDAYTPQMLKAGIKCMIGKGNRSGKVREALVKHRAVYLAVVGGAGALIASTIKQSRILAFEELGAEAVFELEVENMPAIVINDIHGNDLYDEGRKKYRKWR